MNQNEATDRLPPHEVEPQFAESLRQAAYVFENEKNGRFQGAILGCRAVAWFIYQRNGGAELAGPFLQIAEAFKELDRGGKPRLFSKKSVPEKQKERSPERKHMQMLTAVALEVLVRLGEERSIAADKIARHVHEWPGMRAQMIKGLTVIAWRRVYRKSTEERRKLFDKITGEILAQSDPAKVVSDLLRNGPPGMFQG
jgi:hypothetical protein